MRARVRRYHSTIGLPSNQRFIPVGYSGLKTLACGRQFFFSEVQGLQKPATQPLRLGRVWDAMIKDVYCSWQYETEYKIGDLTRCAWCDDGPCGVCDGTRRGPLARAEVEWSDHEFSEEEKVEDDLERLYRSMEGYLLLVGAEPMEHYRVAAVDVQLARPVPSLRGRGAYRGRVVLDQRDDGLWQMASGPPDPERERRVVSWPWYLVGELDAVLVHRETGAAYVLDAKYTGQPTRYLQGLQNDPQLPGYAWLLDGVRDWCAAHGISRVAGVVHDATDSRYQSDPKELKWRPPKVSEMRELADARGVDVSGLRKSTELMEALGIEPEHGGFSVAQNDGTPAWRYRRALEDAGLDPAPYQEHVSAQAEKIDAGLYRRYTAPTPPERLSGYARELYASCRAAAQLRRLVAEPGDLEPWHAVEVAARRVPLCTMPGGFCSYSGPCAAGSGYVTDGYEIAPGVLWDADAPDPEPENPDQMTLVEAQ